ncbi:MAG: hypothetical protein PHY40_03445 [Patescibacteria group bacterium]|nr:hypothetical protein [Patescibacteria group bacterium]
MLEHIFGSKTRIKLLRVFFRYPAKSFYVRELSRAIDAQLNAVRRELGNLEKVGIIESAPAAETEGDLVEDIKRSRSKYFRLKKDSLIAPEFKSLLEKAELLEEQEIIDELKNNGGKIKLMVLSGVFVGEDDAKTDLLLVGEALKPLVISKLIKKFEELFDKTLRYTIMPKKEFSERRRYGDKFIYGIFEGKHRILVDEEKLYS